MRIAVGTVRTASRIAVVAAGAIWAFATFSRWLEPQAASLASICAIDFIAAYALTFLSFAAFPFTRRTDLVKWVVLGAALSDIARTLIQGGSHLAGLAVCATGAIAVLAPSFMERFRSLTRADPHEPFSMVYPNDRRRRVQRPHGSPAAGRRFGAAR